jgi:hypothetical protein
MFSNHRLDCLEESVYNLSNRLKKHTDCEGGRLKEYVNREDVLLKEYVDNSIEDLKNKNEWNLTFYEYTAKTDAKLARITSQVASFKAIIEQVEKATQD